MLRFNIYLQLKCESPGLFLSSLMLFVIIPPLFFPKVKVEQQLGGWEDFEAW